ncbi:hypothetical protein MA16_Dca010599 [Dendrobium catenatum]|uniref:Uncharacterized protein n=1 Tax=Dendrobium catenatum TaxID=906689 RepID=A0A2I0VZL6_9ASPA|nr:hypothetical protein MA16_Dca010599 [Dendrobium catenatum]
MVSEGYRSVLGNHIQIHGPHKGQSSMSVGGTPLLDSLETAGCEARKEGEAGGMRLDVDNTHRPVITYQPGSCVPKISLPIFGLSSYKFKGSMWHPNGEYGSQLTSSLLEAADNWLRLLGVKLPDYLFFASHGARRR